MCVYEAVQKTCLEIEVPPEVVLDIFVYSSGGEGCVHASTLICQHTQVVRDHVQCLRVMLYLRVQTGKVKPVENVVLLDLAEVLIALGRQKP